MRLSIGLLVIVSVACQEYEGDVLIATDEHYDTIINQNEVVLMEFYAPWCSHCMEFAPYYQNLAKQIGQSNDLQDVVVAKLDTETNQMSTQRNKIMHLPDFKLFIHGYKINYDGQRSVDQLIEFIRKNLEETLDQMDTVEDVQELTQEFPVVVLYFLEPSQSANLKIFNVVSKYYDDIAFAYTTQDSVRQAYKAKKNSILLLKDFDERRNEFKSKLTDQSLMKFIDEHGFPSFGEFDERAETRIFKRHKSALFLFWNEDPECLEWKDTLEAMSPYLKKRAQVVTVHPKDGFLANILGRIGQETVNFPEIFYYKPINAAQPLAYRFQEAFTEENLLRFIEFAELGKLERAYRTQSKVQTHDGPILNLVSAQFQEQVVESGKDVLVLFWSDESRESKDYKLKFRGLGNSLRNNKNVKLVQMQVPQNEIPNLQIRRVPHLILWCAKQPSRPVEYTDRLVEADILRFLQHHTSFDWVPLRSYNDL